MRPDCPVLADSSAPPPHLCKATRQNWEMMMIEMKMMMTKMKMKMMMTMVRVMMKKTIAMVITSKRTVRLVQRHRAK